MIDLRDFIGFDAEPIMGENIQMWVWIILGHHHVGDGVFRVYKPQDIFFEGEISQNEFLLNIQVYDDRNMIVIINNEKAKEAVYSVEGKKLLIDITFADGTKVRITSERVGKETYLMAEGNSIHLAKGRHR